MIDQGAWQRAAGGQGYRLGVRAHAPSVGAPQRSLSMHPGLGSADATGAAGSARVLTPAERTKLGQDFARLQQMVFVAAQEFAAVQAEMTSTMRAQLVAAALDVNYQLANIGGVVSEVVQTGSISGHPATAGQAATLYKVMGSTAGSYPEIIAIYKQTNFATLLTGSLLGAGRSLAEMSAAFFKAMDSLFRGLTNTVKGLGDWLPWIGAAVVAAFLVPYAVGHWRKTARA